MAIVTSVPLNTMLADLDESVRALLKRELGRHGFDGVDVVFEAPTKEWAAALSSPTVNLFLYDIREATDRRINEWKEQRGNGHAVEHRPPLRVEVSYAVTAWTRAVEDEHRLLSQVLAVLYAYTVLPDDILAGTLANGSQPFPLDTKTASGRGAPAARGRGGGRAGGAGGRAGGRAAGRGGGGAGGGWGPGGGRVLG